MSLDVRDELDPLTSEELLTISKDVAYYRNKYRVNRIVGDEIFTILEQEARVLFYPIQNDEICAFFRKVDNYRFVFINTAIPYEKQVFAAAHELAHVWNSSSRVSEILHENALKGYVGNSEALQSDLSEQGEQIANRFAAEFLVETRVLKEEIEKLQIPHIKMGESLQEDLVQLLKGILVLMDIFLVPYKTIVRRLYEVHHIDPLICKELLTLQARGDKSFIQTLQRRFQLCEKNNFIPKRSKLDNLVDLTITTFENRLCTYEKLESLLKLVDMTPATFDIYPTKAERLTEDELDAYLADEE